MTVLQDYLMDSFGDDGLDDLYEPPSESSEGVDPYPGLFDDALDIDVPFAEPIDDKKPIMKPQVLPPPPPQQQPVVAPPPPPQPPKRRKTSSNNLAALATQSSAQVSGFPKAPAAAAKAPTGFQQKAQAPRTKTQAQIDRRRDRNRILARRTRLRKKFFFESLQQQVAELERENAALKEIMRQHPELAEHANAAPSAESLIFDGAREAAAEDVDLDHQPQQKKLETDASKKATEILTKNDMALMRLVQGAQRSFCITDPSLDDNPIVYASNSFLEQTGYTLDQVVGRNCRFLQGPLTDRATVTKVRDHVERGQDVGVTILNYRADGTTFWNQLFVAALRDINEKIVNFVGVQIPVPGPDPGVLAAKGSLKHPAEPGMLPPDYAGAAFNSVLCAPSTTQQQSGGSSGKKPAKIRRTSSSSSFVSVGDVATSTSKDDDDLLAKLEAAPLSASTSTATLDDGKQHINVLNRLIQLPHRVVQGTDLATVGAVSNDTQRI